MKMLLNKSRLMDIVFDDKDLCKHCQNKKICPLIRYIKDDVLVLRFGKIDVKCCELFKQKKGA